MKHLVFVGPGRLEWEEAPDPMLRDGRDTLVRPLAVAGCDLDPFIIAGRTLLAAPFPIGHEFVAEIVEAGHAVSSLAPGERVVVPFQISCGACGRCRAGLTANCEAVPPQSMYGFGTVGGDWGGAFADVVRVPFADHMLVRVPEGVSSPEAASAGDNLADAWRAVAPALWSRPGVDVLVVSDTGPIPLYATAMALALGAAVDFADPAPGRRALAAAIGANPVEVEAWPRRLGRHSVTVNCSPDMAALACAVRSTEPGGTCTSTAIFFEATTPMPLLDMYATGVTFGTGRVHARTNLPDVLRLLQKGLLRTAALAPRELEWEAAPEELPRAKTKLVFTRPRR